MTPALSGSLRAEMGTAACQVLHWVLVDRNVANPGNQSPQRQPGVSAWTNLIENRVRAMCTALSKKRKQNLEERQ